MFPFTFFLLVFGILSQFISMSVLWSIKEQEHKAIPLLRKLFLSLAFAGMGCLFVYAFLMKDPVLFCGQLFFCLLFIGKVLGTISKGD